MRGGGGGVVEDVNPKSHLMLINADPCLAPASNAGATRHSFSAGLERELHLWRSGGLCCPPPNGKTTEIKEALSTDQVLLWSVSLLHTLIIVVSCLVMTQSSSTENHYPGCVMR